MFVCTMFFQVLFIKRNVWRIKENEIYLIKTWMNVFVETKTNEENEIYEDILGGEILSRKQERKGDFRNVAIDLHL